MTPKSKGKRLCRGAARPHRSISIWTRLQRIAPHGALFALLFQIASLPSHSEEASRALAKIDVPGVIQITRITQPDEYLLLNGQLEEEISPDERHFFLITRYQDLALNKNIYKLVLFESEGLDKIAAQGRSPLKGRVLVETHSSSDFVFEDAVRSAKWLDRSTIVFLGEFADQPAQVFTINIETDRINQLTYHDSPVLAFACEPKSRFIVYIAREPVDNSYMQRASFVAGNTSLTRILFPDRLPVQHLIYRYYRSFAGHPDTIKPLGEPFALGRLPPLMSISPNGKWVITRSSPRSLADSLRLASAYPPLHAALSPYFASDEDPESLFTEDYSSMLMRMRIFDVKSGQEMPWFDVPDATSIGREWPFAYWMPSGESVVIANTYLPLDGVDREEREKRSISPALIEYWPRSGRFIQIAALSAESQSFQGLYSSTTLTEVVFVKESGKFTVFRREGATWTRDDALLTSLQKARSVRGRLGLVQSANQSPDVAWRMANGKYFPVTELNPQLRLLDIGKAVPYTWRDSSNREWRGGLLLPTDFDSSRRYPLVIQLHGFSEDQFYLDGARQIASGMAGRAYLREGILVLAVPTNHMRTGNQRDMLFVNAEGVKAAVDRLNEEGVVDPDRVGIVGFSATGYVAQHILTFSGLKVRAATLADPGQSSLFSAVAYFYGFYKPGMLQVERRLGAKPWGDDATTWARRDPSLHTDCIEAAVRYEFNGLDPQQGWDSYALLRRQYKPVEAVFFPRAAHQLRRPQERFDSLQGNVNWFRFWLKEEDPDSGNPAQSQRWQQMKARAPRVFRHPACTVME